MVIVEALILAAILVRFGRLCRYSKAVGPLSREMSMQVNVEEMQNQGVGGGNAGNEWC